MNISSINVNSQAQTYQLRNNQQVQFRGIVGEKLLTQAQSAGKKLELSAVLKEVSGALGLNSGKVKDVLESFIEKINLQELNNGFLNGKLKNIEQELEKIKEENNNTFLQLNETIRAKDEHITSKTQAINELTAQVKKLEVYKQAANIKSVDELDVIMPEQVLAAIAEAKENFPNAIKSALEFAFTGKGQEALLKYLELNNIILKAKEDGIDKVPEVAEVLYDKKNPVLLGYDTEDVARGCFTDALKQSSKGTLLFSKSISSQVRTNLEAFLAPLRNPKYTYRSINEIFTSVERYHNAIAENKKLLIEKRNFKFIEFVESDSADLNASYYAFENEKGQRYEIEAGNLACGYFGIYRLFHTDGKQLF